ncbi:MAG TPA: hypothetical protein VGR90_10480 [Acidimicrobiales bacterium]|nr:hypothetical protein [Acidimicrobiales bacterium]
MTRHTEVGPDYTDPAAYSGTGSGLATSRSSLGRRGGGHLVTRAVGAIVLAIAGVWLAWHLLGLVVGAVFLAVKLAILVGLVGLVIAAVRRFR